MELREKIFLKICEGGVGIGPEQMNAADMTDAILSLPEIKEGEQLRRLCYLHDGPGGVSVQMRAVDS